MEDEEEEENLFITPSQKQMAQKRRNEQTSTPVPKRGRITHFFTPSQE